MSDLNRDQSDDNEQEADVEMLLEDWDGKETTRTHSYRTRVDKKRGGKTMAAFEGFAVADNVRQQHEANLILCLRLFSAMRLDAQAAMTVATLLQADVRCDAPFPPQPFSYRQTAINPFPPHHDICRGPLACCSSTAKDTYPPTPAWQRYCTPGTSCFAATPTP